MESQKNYNKTFSFEFFPPRTPASEQKLQESQQRLAKLKPDFFSVTYGAGGGTRTKTFQTVCGLRDSTGIDSAPHISCIGSSREELITVIHQYKDEGFDRTVTLRGDLPSGVVGTASFRYASELVELIRKETGDHFHIHVACYPEFHPQAKSPVSDMENLKRKIEAGANAAITQYFYNPDAYFRFIDDCEKLAIDVPILPGIMPIASSTQLIRFSDTCGAEIPAWILKRLVEFGDDRAGIRAFGIDVVSRLCETLLVQGAPGLHIYTMNQADASEAIWHNLSIGP